MVLKNFVLRHWEGKFSLPVSYWLIGTLLGTGLIVTSVILAEVLELFTESLTTTAWLQFLILPFIWVVLLWIYVGIWKSATHYLEQGKSIVWGRLAKLGVIVGLLQITTTIVNEHIPTLNVMKDFLTGSDPIGKVTSQVIDDGRTLYVSGVFGNGSSKEIISQLNRNLSIKRIHLNSLGGRYKEVLRVSDEIQLRKLETYVEKECLSFCTVVFLSGVRRYATPQARIGFHAPYGYASREQEQTGRVSARTLYQSFGLPREFINRILDTPSESMWYPGYDELLRLGVISALTSGGESKLLGSVKTLTTESVKSVMMRIPIWQSFEKKYPGILDTVAKQITDGSKKGMTDADIQNLSRNYIATFQSKAIAESTPQLRVEFAKLAMEQSREISRLGPTFCSAFLQGNLDITKSVSKTLVKRESDITISALEAKFIAPQGFSENRFQQYLETAVKDLNTQELSAMADTTQKPTTHTCNALVKFYEGINGLPTNQIDIVMYGLLKQ